MTHLPCPLEKFAPETDAAPLLRDYTSQPLETFRDWMARDGLQSVDELLRAVGDTLIPRPLLPEEKESCV